MPTFTDEFLGQTARIMNEIDRDSVEGLARAIARIREDRGRLIVLGVGGSAGHASHAVNDFRKICGIQAYAPTDNVSELTARINDEGWDKTFVEWLVTSQISPPDGVLIFSVGGGDKDRGVSTNLISAIDLCKERGTTILGIVGRDGGYTARHATQCVVIPPLFDDFITPHTEGICAIIWHLLVSHPVLAQHATKWESFRSQGGRK